jgi:hypothetical protein
MTYYITNIDWDTNRSEQQEELLRLPQDVLVYSSSLDIDNFNDDEVVGNALGDYLTTLYGFEVNGFVFVDNEQVSGGEK